MKELYQINKCTQKTNKEVLVKYKAVYTMLDIQQNPWLLSLLTWFYLQCRQDSKLSHVPIRVLGLTFEITVVIFLIYKNSYLWLVMRWENLCAKIFSCLRKPHTSPVF